MISDRYTFESCIFAASNIDFIVSIIHKIYKEQIILIHIKIRG